MDYEDIAEVVGTSVMAARMACSRARQKVKEEFEKIMSYGV
jgi:DNA-directed RNA polymerase specialized sigma24 family protein